MNVSNPFAATLCVAACAAVHPHVSAVAPGEFTRPEQRPFVLLNPAEILALRQRVREEPWARKAYGVIEKSANEWLTREITVPREPGRNGRPFYAAPDSGLHLQFRWDQPHNHWCPGEKRHYTGSELDANWRDAAHQRILKGILDLALAYQIQQEPKYAVKARQLILAYPEFYPELPPMQRKGRLFWQTLDEAVWVLRFGWAYDLLWETFSEEERTRVEERVLRPASESVLSYKLGVSNWQTWHNAALTCVGALLRDTALIDFALNDPAHGLLHQLDQSILADGIHYERALPAYHFYTAQALLFHAELLNHVGVDVFREPRLRLFFRRIAELSLPGGRFPYFGEAGHESRFMSTLPAPSYTWAYARTQDAFIGKVLNELCDIPPNADWATINSKRGASREELLFGPQVWPTPTSLQRTSLKTEPSNFCVLRSGPGAQDMHVHITYGTHHEAHSQFDSLSFTLWADNQMLIPDFGCCSYKLPERDTWFRTTLSHNTVVVGRQNMKHAPGSCLEFVGEGPVKVFSGKVDSVYPQTLERNLFVTDRYVVDLFVVRPSPEKRRTTFDYTLHFNGSVDPEAAFAPSKQRLGESDGYQHLADMMEADASKGINLRVLDPQHKRRLRVLVAGRDKMTAFLAQTPGRVPPRKPTTPMLLLRQEGESCVFAVVLERAGASPSLTAVECVPVKVDGRDYLGLDHVAARLATAEGDVYVIRSNGRVRLRVDGRFDFQGRLGVRGPDGTWILQQPEQ
ncbi:MAG: heparinase II/III family protein [Lentisphaeria bacterium]|nr:heparinase II/III family protein [Lentisphaeria bacterium]